MKVKNSYKKSNLPFVPYVYYIKHLPTGIWYIGSKYAKSAHPSTFLKTYFTSSKLIQSLLSDSEMSDIEYRILKTFSNIEDTVNYEQRLLVKTKSVSNPMSANLNDKLEPNKLTQSNFKTKLISNTETKQCIRVKFDTEILDGWVEGNINNKPISRMWFLWWHDPITLESTVRPPVVLPPTDWIWGRPKTHSNAKSLMGKNKGCFYVNDGVTTIQLTKEAPIPDGWVIGHLTKKIREAKIKANKDPIIVVCPICQTIIDNTHKKRKTLTCSHSCAAKLRNSNRGKLILSYPTP